MKFSYLEDLLHRANKDSDGQLVVTTLLSLEFESPELLPRSTLNDAMYRTMLKHYRLWCRIKGSELEPVAFTLQDVVPFLNFKIATMDQLSIKDKQRLLENQLNQQFKEEELGWKLDLHLSLPRSTPQSHIYEMHLCMTLLHELGDANSAIQVCKDYITSLEEHLHEKTRIRLSQAVPAPEEPIDTYQYIHPFHGNIFQWISEFVFRLWMGFVMCMQSFRGIFRVQKPYSGCRIPTMLHEKTTGYRIIQFDSDTMKNLKSHTPDLSLVSIISVAGLTAYSNLLHMFHNVTNYYTLSQLVDIRDKSHSRSIGLANYPVSLHDYEMNDVDLFWDHAKRLHSKFAERSQFLGAFIRVMRWIPIKLSSFFLERRSVYDKRDSSFSILDVSNTFDSDTFSFAKITSILTSCNSYWTGNRYLFHLTVSKVNGIPVVSVAYPSYMVTEKEIDQFVMSMKLSLLRASFNSNTTITKCRDIFPTPKEQLIINDDIKWLLQGLESHQ